MVSNGLIHGPSKRTAMDVIRTLLTKKAYTALSRIFTVFTRPFDVLVRYSFATGKYPCVISLRTPVGIRHVTMKSFHDVRSLVVCFAKEDYRVGNDISCAVDFGSNVGMSGLYFLTRNPNVRAYLFEPLPENIACLTGNLSGLESRYRIENKAVALHDGVATFLYEPTGRYGGIENTIDEHEYVDRAYKLRVATRNANSILDEILAREGFIDVLKINIEGLEVPVLESLRPDILERIGVICAEIFHFPGELSGFRKGKYGSNVTRFENTRMDAARCRCSVPDAATGAPPSCMRVAERRTGGA